VERRRCRAAATRVSSDAAAGDGVTQVNDQRVVDEVGAAGLAIPLGYRDRLVEPDRHVRAGLDHPGLRLAFAPAAEVVDAHGTAVPRHVDKRPGRPSRGVAEALRRGRRNQR
jgi:hypothetical protein